MLNGIIILTVLWFLLDQIIHGKARRRARKAKLQAMEAKLRDEQGVIVKIPFPNPAVVDEKRVADFLRDEYRFEVLHKYIEVTCKVVKDRFKRRDTIRMIQGRIDELREELGLNDPVDENDEDLKYYDEYRL